MRFDRCRAVLVLIATLAVMAAGQVMTVLADEGMWLLNAPPRQLLQEKYHFDLSDAWLTRARMAAVRFNSGGSGGFVSADGLIVTNHHVGADCLQKLSPKDKDYYRDGFYAPTRADELKCPDLELNVLVSIEDVTNRITAAVKPDLSPEAAFKARRAVMADIEKESQQQTGLRSDVVTLFHGGQYHLYRYKKYTDVRLVFAPEHAIASFGGDVDNFEYPRFCLDIRFFRAYEQDKPVRPDHYFRWSTHGPKEQDLVFVIGNPGSTNRLDTLARLIHRRDVTLPYTLNRLRAREALLRQLADRGPEEARLADHDLPHVANARKAFAGQYQGLLDPAILRRKAEEERAVRSRVEAEPKLSRSYGSAWERIASAAHALAGFEREYVLLERGDAFDSRLFVIARHLLRLADERPKANAERLREYRDSNLESREFNLFSPEPIFPELERIKLAGSLTFLAEQLGGDHPLTQRILAGKPPAARASEFITGTRLADPAERRRLATGGKVALSATDDAMLTLARLVDAESRTVRQRYESEVEEVERQAYSQISRARFELDGGRTAPDATFTLRVAFGVVRGYNADGSDLTYSTTAAGLFERARRQGQREPFALPRRWRDGQSKLDPTTPIDFVSTADTIGGNSGSPVLNRDGELVGINFDRNRYGLVRNFVYTDEQARHIAVHSRGVLEILRVLYEAPALVRELVGND